MGRDKTRENGVLSPRKPTFYICAINDKITIKQYGTTSAITTYFQLSITCFYSKLKQKNEKNHKKIRDKCNNISEPVTIHRRDIYENLPSQSSILRRPKTNKKTPKKRGRSIAATMGESNPLS